MHNSTQGNSQGRRAAVGIQEGLRPRTNHDRDREGDIPTLANSTFSSPAYARSQGGDSTRERLRENSRTRSDHRENMQRALGAAAGRQIDAEEASRFRQGNMVSGGPFVATTTPVDRELFENRWQPRATERSPARERANDREERRRLEREPQEFPNRSMGGVRSPGEQRFRSPREIDAMRASNLLLGSIAETTNVHVKSALIANIEATAHRFVPPEQARFTHGLHNPVAVRQYCILAAHELEVGDILFVLHPDAYARTRDEFSFY